MKDVLKLVLTAIRQTKRFFKDDGKVGLLWKSDAWGGLLEQLTGSEKYGQATGLHSMCKQVRDTTRISGPRKLEAKTPGEAAIHGEKPSKSKAKRKAEEIEAPSEKPRKQRKKKAKVAVETN